MKHIALLTWGLTACHAEPPSASYFEAHPQEAHSIVRACNAGSRRGPVCENARTGIAAQDAARRLNLFKQSFE